MAVVQRTIDSTATGSYLLSVSTAASNARTALSESISDSSNEFALTREIRLSRRDFKLFLVALETDQEPNEKLKAAAEEYKRIDR